MRARRAGFVLLAALWLLVALSAVGLDAALRARTRRLASANVIDATRARAAAIAGTEYARSRLTAAMLDRASQLRADALSRARTTQQQRQALNQSLRSLFSNSDPSVDPWREPDELVDPDMAFGDARYTLRLRDTGAALNLNYADEDMLRQFFADGMHVDFSQADHLAQAIMDWRDEDDLPSEGGAEREQYIKADMPMLPPNRDFAEIDELRYVMGMTPELFAAIRPYVTLIGSGIINVNAAPEPVLEALPGMTPATAATIMQLRDSGTYPRSSTELRQMLPAAEAADIQANLQAFNRSTTFATNEVEILADGRVDGGPVHVQATVVVTRTTAGAAVIWRQVD